MNCNGFFSAVVVRVAARCLHAAYDLRMAAALMFTTGRYSRDVT